MDAATRAVGGGRIMNQWITIDFKNGEICHYKPDEYTDYYYDKKYFIVIKDKQWIGLYNLDEIRYVEIGTVEDAEKSNDGYTF